MPPKAFGHDEMALLVPPAGRAFVRTALLILAGAVLAVLSLSRLLRGTTDAIVLLVLAIAMTSVAFAANRQRVKLEGDRFEIDDLWGSERGSADELLGWDVDLSDQLRLLRRRDLKWIRLPTVVGFSLPDDPARRWVLTFLPGIEPHGLRQVRRGYVASPARLIWRLQQPLPAAASFCRGEDDIELARVAHAVRVDSVFEARESLQRLLSELPIRSVALPFVFDALAAVGNEASAAFLEREEARFIGEAANHWARAFSTLATPAQLATLQRLAKEPDRFRRTRAKRALRRLGQQP